MPVLNASQGRIRLVAGADFDLRVVFTLAGAHVDPTDLAAFAPATTFVDFYPAAQAMPPAAVAFDMLNHPLTYANPNIGVNNVWKVNDPASVAIVGAWVIRLDRGVFSPLGFADCGRHGAIRIHSTAMIPEFDEIWVDFEVVRFSDSQFQNLMLGSNKIAGTGISHYPMESEPLGANHVDFNMRAGGNLTETQPDEREFVAVTGTIPE